MKITFTLEEVGDDIGLSIDIPKEVPEDSKLMHAAAQLYGNIQIKEPYGNGNLKH